jgi:hypothetical protein
MTITWHRVELTRDLLRCDLCGKQADALHFLSDGEYPNVHDRDAHEGVEAVLSCPEHDAGGYWMTLDRWLDEEEDFPDHVRQKLWGCAALFAWSVRVEQALREAAERDGGES